MGRGHVPLALSYGKGAAHFSRLKGTAQFGSAIST